MNEHPSVSHQSADQPAADRTHLKALPERSAGLTLRIPRPNWQVTALLLVALIAGFQTFQLARLKDSVSAKTVATTAASQTASPAASSSAASGDLQSQVGGC